MIVTFLKQLCTAGLGDIHIIVRTMFATIPTAAASFKVIFCCEHYVSLFVVIKINAFCQLLLHGAFLLIVHPYQELG